MGTLVWNTCRDWFWPHRSSGGFRRQFSTSVVWDWGNRRPTSSAAGDCYRPKCGPPSIAGLFRSFGPGQSPRQVNVRNKCRCCRPGWKWTAWTAIVIEWTGRHQRQIGPHSVAPPFWLNCMLFGRSFLPALKAFGAFNTLKAKVTYSTWILKSRAVPWYGKMGQPHVMLSCRGRHFGIS